MDNEDILENLSRAIAEYDADVARDSARKAVAEGIDPLSALDVMTKTIQEIGDAFGRGDLWLPELVAASDALQAATPVLEEEIRRRSVRRESLGIVIAGTVFGDIHSIGKTMVATLLTASGFQVQDLGVDVTNEQFIEAIRKSNADLLAMSALLTTTCVEQEKVIMQLKGEGIKDRVKVMVGGAAVTEEFARDIGADGYDPTAPGAVELAKKLTGL